MGSYVNNNLIRDEVVKYEAKISIWALLPQIALGFILVIFAFLSWSNGAFFWIFLTFGFGVWIYPAIPYFTTELVITNKRVIAKFGLIRRDTIELKIGNVESIQVQQGILARIFNFGSIIISGAGNPQAPITSIDSPLKFRKFFLEIQEGE